MILYARRKEWPIDSVSVRGHVRADHHRRSQSLVGTRTERITQEISLEWASSSEEQRARLLEIARKCPVHRTLTDGLEIVTLEMSDDVVVLERIRKGVPPGERPRLLGGDGGSRTPVQNREPASILRV